MQPPVPPGVMLLHACALLLLLLQLQGQLATMLLR